MFHRLNCAIKSGIDRFLSQELSPEEIEKMHLNEGLGLEDVNATHNCDIAALDFFQEKWEEYPDYPPWDDSIYDGTLDFRNTLPESSMFDD